MSDVFEQLSILYIFLVAGWFIGKLKKEKATHSDILSVLLVNIFLPCKVFGTFANNFSLSYFKENITLPLSALILLTVLALFSHFASKLLTKKNIRTQGLHLFVYCYKLCISRLCTYRLGIRRKGSVFVYAVCHPLHYLYLHCRICTSYRRQKPHKEAD